MRLRIRVGLALFVGAIVAAALFGLVALFYYTGYATRHARFPWLADLAQSIATMEASLVDAGLDPNDYVGAVLHDASRFLFSLERDLWRANRFAIPATTVVIAVAIINVVPSFDRALRAFEAGGQQILAGMRLAEITQPKSILTVFDKEEKEEDCEGVKYGTYTIFCGSDYQIAVPDQPLVDKSACIVEAVKAHMASRAAA